MLRTGVGCSEGCDLNASFILTTMSHVVQAQMGANGYLRQGGGGIETAGGAVAVNDMLLQSFEGFLRFFPVWPRSEDASFTTLRAVGAFLVSASLESGVVKGVEVVSEAGLNCTFVSPWEHMSTGTKGSPSVSGAGKPVTVASVAGPGGLSLWRFETLAGQTYRIAT